MEDAGFLRYQLWFRVCMLGNRKKKHKIAQHQQECVDFSIPPRFAVQCGEVKLRSNNVCERCSERRHTAPPEERFRIRKVRFSDKLAIFFQTTCVLSVRLWVCVCVCTHHQNGTVYVQQKCKKGIVFEPWRHCAFGRAGKIMPGKTSRLLS